MTDDQLAAIPADVYLRHLDQESRRFADVLADVDPAVPVPTCPAWTAADLVWHLTEVQWFWGSIAGGPILDGADLETVEADKPPRPADYRDLSALFDAARRRLAASIADGPDDTPLWSWAAEQTLGFARRRQAHEALVHRVDAELTAGVPVEPLDPTLAADGVDEVLRVMWAEMPGWASFSAGGGVVAIETTDTGNEWLVELGRMTGTSTSTGKTYDEPSIAVLELGSRAPDAQVRGRASDVDQWLWNRGIFGIDRSGSQSALDGLATLVSGGVQ
ncbi:MAG: maleylpyruvate isomerase N-terminal domain-containing protein [Geodermatophilaceae bacterium]|nr:maleylpyruvate isomerase N-terminal domain-containing protein [Geodermatophilaceae bacterium]